MESQDLKGPVWVTKHKFSIYLFYIIPWLNSWNREKYILSTFHQLFLQLNYFSGWLFKLCWNDGLDGLLLWRLWSDVVWLKLLSISALKWISKKSWLMSVENQAQWHTGEHTGIIWKLNRLQHNISLCSWYVCVSMWIHSGCVCLNLCALMRVCVGFSRKGWTSGSPRSKRRTGEVICLSTSYCAPTANVFLRMSLYQTHMHTPGDIFTTVCVCRDLKERRDLQGQQVWWGHR